MTPWGRCTSRAGFVNASRGGSYNLGPVGIKRWVFDPLLAEVVTQSRVSALLGEAPAFPLKTHAANYLGHVHDLAQAVECRCTFRTVTDAGNPGDAVINWSAGIAL